MRQYLLSAAAALLLTSFGATAQNQEKEKSKDKKLGEYDEIVIKKKKNTDKDTKVTVEINDDQVLINGKPIDEYVDDEVSVRLRSPKRYMLDGNSPFRNQQWKLDAGDDVAFLGVSTEGSKEGTKIVTISENSAAEKAGLKKGDVITKLNDKPVYDHEQLTEIVRNMKPEEKVTITYKRDGKENKTTATLGKRQGDVLAYGFPPNAPYAPNAPIPPIPPMQFDFDGGGKDLHQFFYRNDRPRLGIKAQDTEDGKGVKVLDVEEGSAAEKAGIKEDDIITSFEGKDVNSAEELAKASREIKDKSSLKVQLKRNGKSQTVDVKIPKKLKTAEL